MERRSEGGMEAAERRALSARVERLERRVAELEAALAPEAPAAEAARPAVRRAPPAGADDAAETRRKAEARAPRHEGQSLRRLGVTRRSDESRFGGLVRVVVFASLGFLAAVGVGWVVIVAQPGAGGGWSGAFGGPPPGFPASGGFDDPGGGGGAAGSDN